MPKFAPNKMPTTVKKRYFELLREGYKGAAAARVVGISASCGSNWFIEAGSMIVPDPGPISSRFLTQNDRIAIADGLHAQQTVKQIAASIGKSFQTVYREIISASLALEQPVQVDDEVADVGVVHRRLRLAAPSVVGGLVVRIDSDDVELGGIDELGPARVLELAAEDEVQELSGHALLHGRPRQASRVQVTLRP
jgi:hypothetical protein